MNDRVPEIEFHVFRMKKWMRLARGRLMQIYTVIHRLQQQLICLKCYAVQCTTHLSMHTLKSELKRRSCHFSYFLEGTTNPVPSLLAYRTSEDRVLSIYIIYINCFHQGGGYFSMGKKVLRLRVFFLAVYRASLAQKNSGGDISSIPEGYKVHVPYAVIILCK